MICFYCPTPHLWCHSELEYSNWLFLRKPQELVWRYHAVLTQSLLVRLKPPSQGANHHQVASTIRIGASNTPRINMSRLSKSTAS